MLTMTNAASEAWTYATIPQESVSSTPHAGLDSGTDLAGAACDYDYTSIGASDIEVSVESGSISRVASEGESDVYCFGGGPSASGEEARDPTEDLTPPGHALTAHLHPSSPDGRSAGLSSACEFPGKTASRQLPLRTSVFQSVWSALE